MRLVVPVKLETFRLVLGEAVFKNYRSVPGQMLWIFEDGCLFIGDVYPHQTLLAMGTLVREKCPEDKFKKRLMPLIKKMSPKLAELAMPVVSAGTCDMEGRQPAVSNGAFGIGDMPLTDAMRKELSDAVSTHFREHKILSQTGKIPALPD